MLQLDRVVAHDQPRVEGIVAGPVDLELQALRARAFRGNLRTLVPEVHLLLHLYLQAPVRAALAARRAVGALAAVFKGGHGLDGLHRDLERVAFSRVVHFHLEPLGSTAASLDHDLHTPRHLRGRVPLGLLALLLVVHGHGLREGMARVHLVELGDERLAQGSRVLPEFAVLLVVHLRVAQHELTREEKLPYRLVPALLVEALADGVKVDGVGDLLVVIRELLPRGQEDEQLRHLAAVAILHLLDLLEDGLARIGLLRRHPVVVRLLALTLAAVAFARGHGVVVVEIVVVGVGVGFLGLGAGGWLAGRPRGLVVVFRVLNEALVDGEHGAVPGERLDEDVWVLSEDGEHGGSRSARAGQLGSLGRLRRLHELVEGECLGSLVECIFGGVRGGAEVEVRLLLALAAPRVGADTVPAPGIVVGVVARVRSGILLPRAAGGSAPGLGDDHGRTSVHGGTGLHGTGQGAFLVLGLRLMLPVERSERIGLVRDILGTRHRPAPRPHPRGLVDILVNRERPR